MKKYLLDTHVLLWVLMSPNKLPQKVAKILESPNSHVFVSVLSIWEISLKFSLGKMNISFDPSDLPTGCKDLGFHILNLDTESTATFHQLTGNYHKDPFDRMLIWLALKEKMTLISADDNIKMYRSEGLQVIW